jgi:hypothetical protein
VEIVIVVAAIVVALVVPIMIGARIVNARNTGFGSALLAVVILAVLSAAIDALVANDLLAFVAMAATGAMVLAGILGTTFFRGLAVSVIATIIQIGVILLLAGVIAGSGVAVA